MTRTCSGSKPSRRRGGFTLAEVCVATLIMAIGTTAVFSVMLSVRIRHVESGVHDRMQQHAKHLLETLKLYVTADTGSNSVGAPNNSWTLPGDAGWALTPGVHNVTSWLPIDLSIDHQATLSYTVGSISNSGREITVSMNWVEVK